MDSMSQLGETAGQPGDDALGAPVTSNRKPGMVNQGNPHFRILYTHPSPVKANRV